jgi:hypothetical protein
MKSLVKIFSLLPLILMAPAAWAQNTLTPEIYAKKGTVVMLGKPFNEKGETFIKGRFRLVETGPKMPDTPDSMFGQFLTGMALGGRQIDRLQIELHINKHEWEGGAC